MTFDSLQPGLGLINIFICLLVAVIFILPKLGQIGFPSPKLALLLTINSVFLSIAFLSPSLLNIQDPKHLHFAMFLNISMALLILTRPFLERWIRSFFKLDSFSMNRFLHRSYFLYGIFILPILLYSRYDFQLLCMAWLISYLVNAAINRLFAGFTSSKTLASDRTQVWLKLDHTNVLSDIMRFRSEYSVNTPGSHRQTFEIFYPYFCIICSIYIVASSIIPRSETRISLDHLVSSIDGSVLNGVITYKNADSPLSLPPSASSDQTAEFSSSSPAPVQPPSGGSIYRTNNALLEEALSRGMKETVKGNREPSNEPDVVDDHRKRAIDIVNTRNIIFLLVIFTTFWIVGSKNKNASYIDKWKVLNTELNSLKTFAKDNPEALQFCANLIVTEMWGHRSFAKAFLSIMKNNSIDVENSRADRALAEINDKICDIRTNAA